MALVANTLIVFDCMLDEQLSRNGRFLLIKQVRAVYRGEGLRSLLSWSGQLETFGWSTLNESWAFAPY